MEARFYNKFYLLLLHVQDCFVTSFWCGKLIDCRGFALQRVKFDSAARIIRDVTMCVFAKVAANA